MTQNTCVNISLRALSPVATSGAVANRLLDLGDAENKPVTMMKLLKLVYIAHGWHLALVDRPLIDEEVEAWQYGPVVPSLYHAVKHFGKEPVKGRICSSPWSSYVVSKGEKCDKFDTSVESVQADHIVVKVWNVYGHMTGPQLMHLTHEAGTPWTKAWEEKGQYIRGTDIPMDEIRSHFCEKMSTPLPGGSE